MFKELNYFLIFSAAILLLSCNSTEDNTTYFGGKIINPKSDFVILFNGKEQAIDTFFLNTRNTFLGKINDAKEGLYYFKHGPEHQYVYVEPQDSILIRLNTWDFDESLVFSGKGAERNNLLIDCFLDAERDNKAFYAYYDLDPTAFKAKADSLEKIKMGRYEEFLLRNQDESEGFKNILKIALTYPIYSKIENYPLAHKSLKHDTFHEVKNEDFYQHRDFVDYDKDSIMYFNSYREYMMSYFYNITSSQGYEMSSDDFTVELLNTIHQKLHSQKTKNILMRQTVISHFMRRSTCSVNSNAFDTYFKLTTSESDKILINKLLDDAKFVKKGIKLSPFTISDYSNKSHPISKVIKGSSAVIYFWNPEFDTNEYISSKVNYLTTKHPKVTFVVVKIDGNGTEHIKGLDIKKQFYINSQSEANQFLTSKLPRTLLVDRNGVVVNAYASISSQKIYQQVSELEKN